MNDKPTPPTFEVWQITPQLRWVPVAEGDKARTVLEQAWRSPDGRLDWRRVPKIVYSGGPETGD